MRSGYKKLGKYIREVNHRNTDLQVKKLLGVSIQKILMPSIANTVGTNMATYKIIKKNQFAYGPVTSRNGNKISVALLEEFDEAIVSQAYVVFEIINHKELDPEYLMMWFRRPEFDRYARFKSHGSARETFDWDEMCKVELPVPSIEKQREIVKEYNTIISRIKLNEQLNQKLEETAQAIYKQWFVDFEFPDDNGEPYKSSGGEMEFNEELDKKIPKGWRRGTFLEHADIKMGQSPKGDTYNTYGIGTPLINGPVEFGNFYTIKTKWTDSPTKLCMSGDLIVCVRGSTTGKFVKSDGEYCLGRGVCSFHARQSQCFVDLLYRMKIDEMLKVTTGSTFPNWGREEISSFPVIVPADSVVSIFDLLVRGLVYMVENANKESFILEDYKNILLSKMTKV